MDMLSVSYFVATAENLSFTAAARNLYVSQPTISKKIAELEAELGLPLFSRTGKTIQMTAAGKELYYDFKTLQTFFNEIVTHANDIKNSITGSIHIGIPSHMDLGRSIPGFFNAFYRQNPGIKVTLLYDTRQNLINGFFDGSMDCVFFLSFDAERFHDELNVCRFILPSAPHRLLYSPALFPDNPPQSVEAFRNQTFLFYRENHTDYSVSGKSHELLSDFGFSPSILWVDSIEVLLFYVSEAIGVSIVGPSFRLEQSEKIRWILLPTEKSNVGLQMCRKENNNNLALSAFTDALEAWCNKTSE